MTPIEKEGNGHGKRILLTSVFGPYAQDDEFGSRAINPMELYNNQVTRFQGPFSFRMFHNSWGLSMIQANINTPCSLLDFPSRDRFIQELRQRTYDVVGISSIPANYLKVEEMCRLTRKYQPDATIVLGGHVANMPNIQAKTGADHVVKGEGVRWFRHYLGEAEDNPINHPRLAAGFGLRLMGVDLEQGRPSAAVLIPSVGCPVGCNFCATSALFGGKGNAVHFYETGDDLYSVMKGLEKDMGVQSFFVMDENFLLHKKRALRLLDLMRKEDKPWSTYIFSSARAIKSYSIDEIVGLGVSWVWMGLEGKNSTYEKLKGVDTHELVRTLQSHGILVLGSSIIGLDEHTPENLPAAIDYAVSHDTDFHQFMLYTPIAGTPLFKELGKQGALVDPTCSDAPDTHGQLRFAHKHPHIPAGMETKFLHDAFTRDFEVNGPSFVRFVQTRLRGYLNHCNDPDARVRARYAREAEDLRSAFPAGLFAAKRYYRDNPVMHKKIDTLLHTLYQNMGWRARLSAWTKGPIASYLLNAEQRRLEKGWTYEPPTSFTQTNETAANTTNAAETKAVESAAADTRAKDALAARNNTCPVPSLEEIVTRRPSNATD